MITPHGSRHSRGRAFAAPAVFAVAKIAASLCIGAATQSAHAQCGPQWLAPLPPVGVGGFDGTVFSVTSWDPDAAGPIQPWLVVGGVITDAGGREANNVVAWDGVQWHPLYNVTGPSIPDGTNGAVFHLSSFDVDGDGPEPAWLLSSGSLDRTVSLPAWGLRRYVNGEWEMLIGASSQFVQNPIAQWVPYDDGRLPRRLVYGTSDRIHVWDAGVWTQIPARNAPGLDADVRALKAIIPWDSDGNGPRPREIIAALQRQSDENVVRLARWDGGSWNFIAGDIPALYGQLVLGAWDPDGQGPRPEQLLMKADGPLQWFDGVQWNTIGQYYGGQFFVPFDPDGDGPLRELLVTSSSYAWNGTTVQQLPTRDSGVGARALCTWDPDGDGPRPTTIVAGTSSERLSWPTDATINHLAINDGGLWSPIGPGPHGLVETVLRFTHDGQNGLIAAGRFEFAGSVRVNGLAFFDGATWRSLPSPDGTTKAIVSWNDDNDDTTPNVLVASITPNYAPIQIRALVGNQWQDLGGTFPIARPIVASLSGRDADLFVASTDPWSLATTLRQWVNGEWIDRGQIGVDVRQPTTWIREDGPVARAILVLGSGPAAGNETTRLQGWNGEQFIPVGDVLATSTSDYASIMTLSPVDFDGDGPQPQQLVAVGQFDYAAGSGTALDHIAVLIGDHWQPVSVPPEWTSYWSDPNTQYVAQFTSAVWDPDGDGPVAPTLRIFGTRGVPYSSELVTWEYDGQTLREIGVGAPGRPWTAIQWDPDGPGPVPPRLQVGGSVFPSYDIAQRGSVFEAFLDDATPWVATPPRDASGFEGDTITLTASIANGYAELDGGVQFQWRRDGIAIQDGAGGASSTGGVVAGASGTLHLSIPLTLTITNARATDTGDYDLVVSNSCGTLPSAIARVQVTPFCAADIDGSGAIDATDLAAFFTAYEAGASNADVDRNGGIDGADIGAFFAAYQSGC